MEVLKHPQNQFCNHKKAHGLQPMNSFTFKNVYGITEQYTD